MQMIKEKSIKNKSVILFADDNDIVLDVSEKLLKKLGYQPLLAKTGHETIEVFKKYRNEVDLVILDIRMPDLSALEIFAEINKIKPGLKVLIISGDREDERIGELLSLGCIGFMPKPFSVDMLDQKIRDNLCA